MSNAYRLVLAVTGASGMPYALRLAEVLREAPEVEVHMIVSEAAFTVLDMELGVEPEALTRLADAWYREDEIGAPPASGSWRAEAMVVCPCSMNTLAAVAAGLSGNLAQRAADVTLKEGRPLILVPREMPLNRNHLRNMLAAHEAGAVILPPCPGFYHRPETLSDLVDHVVGRILDQLGIDNDLSPRWGES